MEKVYIKDNVAVRNVKEYLKPEYIYLKIDGKLLVKERSYIKKGDYVANNIISPISGIVRNTIYKRNINNDMVKYIVIENDYKEKINRDSKRKKISISSEIRYVLINGIDEIYTSFKRNIIDNYSNLLLEIIDNLTNGIIVYICLSNSDSNSCYKINKYIGSYPNMKIIKIDDFYFNNDNTILKKEVFGYDKDNVFVVDVVDLYKQIRMNNYSNVITVGGSNIKYSGNVIIKEGTLLRDIINYLGGYKNKENISITLNGVLGGITTYNDDIVIDKDIKSIFITNKINSKEEECIYCVKCIRVCPVNLVPVYIMNNRFKKDRLKRMNISKCLECGICSYVCPSDINLKEYIKIAKESLKDE